MTQMPNPWLFDSAVAHPATVDEAAASSPLALAMVAAADIAEPSTSTGGTQEAALAGPPNNRPASALFDGPDIPLAELVGRGFDVDGFVNDCEPLPAFLVSPSQQYLSANELMPLLQALAGRR